MQEKSRTGAGRTSRSGAGARSCVSLIAASAPAQSALAAAAAAALSDREGEGEGEKSHAQTGEALRAAPMSAVREICDAPTGTSQGKVLGVPSCARLSTQGQHLDNLLLRACSIKEETEHLCLRRARDQRGPWACGDVPVAMRQSSVPGGGIHAVNLERKVALGIGFKKTTLAVPEKTISLVSEHALHSVKAVAAATAAGKNERRFRTHVPTLDVHSASLLTEDVTQRDRSAGRDRMRAHSSRGASQRGKQASSISPPQKALKRHVTSRWAVTSRGDSWDFFACTFGPILHEPARLGSDQDCQVGSALHHRGLVTRQRCATTFLPSSLDGVVCPTPPHRRCRGCRRPMGRRESHLLFHPY